MNEKTVRDLETNTCTSRRAISTIWANCFDCRCESFESNLFDRLPTPRTFDRRCDDLEDNLSLSVRRRRSENEFTFDHFARFARRGFVRLHFLSGQRIEFETELFRSIVVDLSDADIDQGNDSTRIVHFLDATRFESDVSTRSISAYCA